MKKRFISSILTIALVLSALTNVALATTAGLGNRPADVAQSPDGDDIIAVYEYGGLVGLVDEQGNFGPERDCDIREFATMLANLFGASYADPSSYESKAITQGLACAWLTGLTTQLGYTVEFDNVTADAVVSRGLACALIVMTLDCGGDGLKSKIISNNPPPVNEGPACVGQFTDVLVGSWFAEPVAWAVGNGISGGTSATSFSPQQNATVTEMFYSLWKANKAPASRKSCVFGGVTEENPFYGAFCWASEKGLVSSDRIDPFGTAATRSDLLWCLWKLAGAPRVSGRSIFADVPDGASYATATRWGVKNGVVSSGENFNPLMRLNRAMLVTMLYNNYRGVNYG